MDGVTALERAYERLGKLAANLSPDQLGRPTPCSEWDVKAMLNHAVGAGWMFTRVNRGEPLEHDSGDLVGEDPAGAVAKVAAANVASWRQPGAQDGEKTYPFGSFPGPAALLINVGETALHAWDLARATGQDDTIDPEVATLLNDFYRQIGLDGYRTHGAFGAEVTVADTASIQDRLLGYTGRTP